MVKPTRLIRVARARTGSLVDPNCEVYCKVIHSNIDALLLRKSTIRQTVSRGPSAGGRAGWTLSLKLATAVKA